MNDRTPEDQGSNTALVVLVVILIAVLIGIFFWWGGGDDADIEVDLPDEVGLIERAEAVVTAELASSGGSPFAVVMRKAPAA